MRFNKALLICIVSLLCSSVAYSQGRVERQESGSSFHNAPRKNSCSTKTSKSAGMSVRQRNQIISNLENNMILVQGGVFQMGTNDLYNSNPVHQVEVDDFYIGKYEVTQEEWHAVTGKKIPTSWKDNKSPAILFDWEDLENFISSLNNKTNKNYRLPTEAEWEWAAQGGQRSLNYKYSGSNDAKEVVSSGYKPVGTMKPNELGLYDMSGNVSELCSDYWGKYSSESQTNPIGVSISNAEMYENKKYYHVVKGGAWPPIQYSPERMYEYRPQFRDKAIGSGNSIGFRLALDLIPNGINQETYLAAKKGQQQAIREVVIFYQQLNNQAQYVKWLERLGQTGDMKAYIQLGNIYRDGKAVAKDLIKAEQFFLLAYDSGDISAKNLLGDLYREQGLYYDKSNLNEALKWFEKGAALGNAECLNNAGLYYWHGKGTAVNYNKAANYFLQSANQDYYHALNNIGTAYLNGLGIEKNEDKAVYWYRRAAEKGHPDAKRMLKQLEKRVVTIIDKKDNEPLIGCTLKCYRNGREVFAWASDIDGQYIVRDIRPGDVLRFEYIGYRSKEIKLKCSEMPNKMTFSLSSGSHKKTEYETKY